MTRLPSLDNDQPSSDPVSGLFQRLVEALVEIRLQVRPLSRSHQVSLSPCTLGAQFRAWADPTSLELSSRRRRRLFVHDPSRCRARFVIPAAMEYDTKEKFSGESPKLDGYGTEHDGIHDIEAAPANKLSRNLKGRHMQMIAIGMFSFEIVDSPAF